MKNIIRISDVILIACLLALAPAVWFVLPSAGAYTGGTAVVRHGGQVLGEINLSSDGQRFYFETSVGRNVAVVENGAVFMAYADCPDGLCVRKPPISRVRHIIACLPNKIVIEIIGGTTADEPDAVI